jgi:hypothetical protein
MTYTKIQEALTSDTVITTNKTTMMRKTLGAAVAYHVNNNDKFIHLVIFLSKRF